VWPGFVLNPENHLITAKQHALVGRLLLERISLRGICRAVGVGLRWLLQFMGEQFRGAPAHLHVTPPLRTPVVILQQLEAEMDELWSFVGKRTNRHWVWIAVDATTRQVIAFHVGARSQACAAQFWTNLPTGYREQAIFYTDHYAVYKGVIPPARHRAISKLDRKTNQVGCFNCTLPQRVSRLVRSYRSQRTLLTISEPSNISFVPTTSPDVQHYSDSTSLSLLPHFSANSGCGIPLQQILGWTSPFQSASRRMARPLLILVAALWSQLSCASRQHHGR